MGLTSDWRIGEGKQQFQEPVIMQGPGPALEEVSPQALAVAVVMGRRLGWHGRRIFSSIRDYFFF
jgi:hypothetical protein